jgi:hypothetical protein
MTGKSFARIACGSASLMLLASANAFASQGPGIAPGTAGAMTRLGMAIIVYGGSAALVVVGLLGALRQR